MSEGLRLSLLFPREHASSATRTGAPNFDDLGITTIARTLDFDQRHSRFIEGVLAALEVDPAIIRYRQEALLDLSAHPALVEQLTAALPELYSLAEAGPSSRWHENAPLPLVGARLVDLSTYVSCVERLWSALNTAEPRLKAQAWLDLRSMLAAIRGDHEYQRLVAELPPLRAQLEQAGSVTLGINLDGQLQPESATILSVQPGRFSGKSNVIERLLGERGTTDAIRGISALYKANEGQQRLPEHELFRDLNRLLERVAAPVATALERYVRISARPLINLTGELIFYLGAIRLQRQIAAAGLPLCLPEIRPITERTCTIREAYSLELALRMQADASAIVRNHVTFENDTSILLLTGPNSGGKTTYARAIAQAQIMFQAGMFIPAASAEMSPVDGVFSHFATAERPGGSGGRLAEELERVAQIFHHATHHSLLIFNEPFSSTDPRSARALASDVVAGLKLLGARTLYITHLHELVDDLVPDGDRNDGVACLSAATSPHSNGAQQEIPTYHIVSGRPQPSEYARELARQHGLSRQQIEQLLRERLPLATTLSTQNIATSVQKVDANDRDENAT